MAEEQQENPVVKILLDNQQIVSTAVKAAIDIGGALAIQQINNAQTWAKEQVDLFFKNLEAHNRGYQEYISKFQNTNRPLFLYGRTERI